MAAQVRTRPATRVRQDLHRRDGPSVGSVLAAGITVLLVVATLTIAGGAGWLPDNAGAFFADRMSTCKSDAGTENPIEAPCAEGPNGAPFAKEKYSPWSGPWSGIHELRLTSLDDNASYLSRFDHPWWRMRCELDPITTLLQCERVYN